MADQDTGPNQIDTPPYPGTTRIENGQAFDVAGKVLGPVDDSGKAAGAAPAFNFGFKPAAAPTPTPAAGGEGFNFGFKAAQPQPEEGSWFHQNIAEPFMNDVHRIKNAILENEGPGYLPYDILTKKMGIKADETGPFAGIDWNKEIPVPPPANDTEATTMLKVLQQQRAQFAATNNISVEELNKKNPLTIEDAKKKIDQLRAKQREEEIRSHDYEGESRLISPERLMTAQEAREHPVLYGLLQFPGQLTTPDNALLMLGTAGAGNTGGAALGFVSKAATLSPRLGILAETVASTPRLISAYFAGQMAIGVGQQIPGLYESKKEYDDAIKAGDTDKAARIKWDATVHATEAAAQAYAAYAAAYHAATGKPEPVAQYAAESTKETLAAMADAGQQMGANAAAGVKAGAKAAKQTVGQAAQKAGALIGRTNDFETAVMRAAKVTPKKAPEIKSNIGETKEDLQAIVNANPNIESPVEFADAIERHLQENEANMQREAGATKDENVPVHPDFRGRIEDRLNQFFDDNRGKFGSPEEVKQAKQDILDRVMQRDQVGVDEDGAPIYQERVPNLFETENTRQGLNNETKPQYATNAKPTTDAYKAGAAQAVDEIRNIIDGAYHERGIENVQEFREKEAKLIQIEEALRGAQAAADKAGEGTVFQSLMKKIGVPSTVIAIAMGHPVGGAAIGAAVLGDQIHQNITNPNVNVGRAVDLAARNPGARPTQIELNPNATGAAPAGSTSPRSTPPPVDHATYAALSSYYGKIIGAVPYDKLVRDFQKELQDVHERKATGTYSQQDAAMEPRRQQMLDKLNAAKMKQRVDAEKAAAKAAADAEKAQAKAAAEQKKQAEKDAAAEEARKQAAIQTGQLPKDTNPHLESLGRGDESGLVSHSPAMKAHAPAMEIPGLGEDITSQDIHHHEWAHIAIGAIDGLEPVEIRTDLHPKVEKGVAAQAIFNGASIRDKAGNIDVEALGKQEVQWLTAKMAGPVSEEVFKGLSRDEVKQSLGNRSDFRQARAMVREVHPDFTPKQVEAVIDAAYDRAHDFLTKPHIADRIRANAAVREEGLSQTLHASHGRVTQFAEDIRNAHNEYTGTDAGPDGGGAGEGGEKAEKRPAEGKKNAGAGEERPGEGASGPSGKTSAASGGAEVKPEESATTKQERAKDLAEKIGARVVGSAAKEGPAKDIDLRIEGAYDKEGVESKLKAEGLTYRGSSLVSPEEAKESGKPYGKGWNRVEHFEGPDQRKTVDVWHDEHPEVSNADKAARGLKERTTGNEADDAAIKAGGGIPGGRMTMDENNHVRMFHDPETGTTLGFSAKEEVTPETVKAKLAKSREAYGIKPEESNAVKTAPEKEEFRGVHYSGVPAEGGVIGGATRGKANAGSEAARVALGAEPGVYAYREGTRPEPQIATRANKYGIEGKKAIADISGAQKDLFEGAYRKGKDAAIAAGDNDTVAGHKGLNAAETAVKNAGFDGYEHKADYPGNVFLFGDQKVGPAGEKATIAEGANKYNEQRGLPAIDATPKPHNVEFAKRVADAFDAMKHEPENPAVAKSYNAMANEVRKQWDYATQKMGMKFEPWTKEGQPYANSKEMVNDVRDNHHLYFFQGGDIKPESPMAKTDPETGLSYNDMFRAVHDLFGHAAHGFEFGPKGEENAYLVHRQMFPQEAIPALTSETRGQNSWVNFGKQLRNEAGEVPKKGEPGYVPQTQRPYAEQKVGLLPEEFHGTEPLNPEVSNSVPLMQNPLPVKGTGEGGEVNTLDLTKALNQWSRKQLPALDLNKTEPAKMTDRAKKIAEDEAKYQLAQSKTGTEWYTTEMKEHDRILQEMRPELKDPAKLSLLKAGEAILSSGQKPYANYKSAVRAWDIYNETGKFPPVNPATQKSWGPRNVAAYGNAFESLNKLIEEKGEKGAADWLLAEHPVKELRGYEVGKQTGVSGKATDEVPGAMILGAKRGPFMQNLHGIESKFTADMWVARTWNRWMGTLDTNSDIEDKGKLDADSDEPRNNTERTLMRESFEKTANKLGLTTSSLQAVLWYYEQALYRAHGLPVESWSFSDAAKRVAKEEKEKPEAEQTGFNFGENEDKKAEAGLEALGNLPRPAGGVHAVDLLNALKKK